MGKIDRKEKISKKTEDKIRKLDFWRLGQLLYESVIGKLPHALNGKTVRFRHLISNDFNQDKIDLEFPETMFNRVNASQIEFTPSYQDFKHLCKQLLTVNVDERLTDFCAIKKHPFFIGVNWNLLCKKQLSALDGFDSDLGIFKPKLPSNGRFDSLTSKEIDATLMMEKWFQTSQLTYKQEQYFNDYVKLVEPLLHFGDV